MRVCSAFALALVCLPSCVAADAADGVALESPLRDGPLRLRESEGTTSFAPRIADGPLPDMPPLRLLPPATTSTLAQAQSAVLREPQAWRNWAALASANHAAGRHEAAHAAARQMRAAAAARREALPLAADELHDLCQRAADALTLLE